VVEVKPPVSIARPDGSSASIVEALVADGTAAVVLTSHNAQGARAVLRAACLVPPCAPDARGASAAELMKVGNVLLLSNAKVNMFQGTPRLALDRSGTMQLAAEGTEVEAQARARGGSMNMLPPSDAHPAAL
jgi:hypothetical protein